MQVAWLEPVGLPPACPVWWEAALGPRPWGGGACPGSSELGDQYPCGSSWAFPLSLHRGRLDQITKASHLLPVRRRDTARGLWLASRRLHWDEGCSQAKKHRLLSPWLWKHLVQCPGCVSMLLHPRKGTWPQDWGWKPCISVSHFLAASPLDREFFLGVCVPSERRGGVGASWSPLTASLLLLS